jgi:hypothetical protein
MKAFLSHSSKDKDVVEPVGTWLTNKGIEVWIDGWSMTPGDSLIEKVGEGIESSDRLVVFLSPNSVDSNWVRKEVVTGLVMELAEEKGLGDKFVIPALLVACKVPIMLRDKLYANFTNKGFDAACEELYNGIVNKPVGPQDRRFENRVFRVANVNPTGTAKYGLVLEFAARMSPISGLYIAVDVGSPYKRVMGWMGPPNDARIPGVSSIRYGDHSAARNAPLFAERFSDPKITSSESYYVYFESDSPFNLSPKIQFLDFYGREP